MSGCVIFVGSSLKLEEARTVWDGAVYRPPVKRGDIPELLDEKPWPAIVGIIDGLFEQVASVGHREIRMLLDRNITVVGGASIGALRSCEMKPFGMHSIGTVARWYQSELIRSDEEVAVAIDPRGYESVSVALVTVRYALTAALDEGLIEAEKAGEIIKTARQIHYKERTWDRLLQGSLDHLKAFLVHPDRDIKRLDALDVVRYCRRLYSVISDQDDRSKVGTGDLSPGRQKGL